MNGSRRRSELKKTAITLVNAAYQEPFRRPSFLPPLGLLYLVSHLRQHHRDVDYVDYQMIAGASPSPEALADLLADTYEVVGIGCQSNHLPLVCEAVGLLKQRHPEKLVILGGIGPSLVCSEVMRSFPAIDLVVRGEGELTLAEALTSIDQGEGFSKVRGVCYRDGASIITTPARDSLADLDSLPLPAYDLVDFDEFQDSSLPASMRRFASVVSSRGCPYHCAFCSNSTFCSNKVRYRDPILVAKEIALLHDRFGRNLIHFTDDIFTLDRNRTVRLCRAIKEMAPEVGWTCATRVDLIDIELMRLMADSGCVLVQYGVESGSQAVLGQLGKGISLDRAIQVIGDSTKVFPQIKVSFMWGFPFETLDDFYRTVTTVRIVSEMGAYINFVFWEPYPGTNLYGRYRDEMRYLEEVDPAHRPRLYNYSQQLLETISKHRTMFTNLSFVPSDTLLTKVSLLRSWGFHEFDLSHFRIPVREEPTGGGWPDGLCPERHTYRVCMGETVRLQCIGGRHFVFRTDTSAAYEIDGKLAELLRESVGPIAVKELTAKFCAIQDASESQLASYVFQAISESVKRGWLVIADTEQTGPSPT